MNNRIVVAKPVALLISCVLFILCAVSLVACGDNSNKGNAVINDGENGVEIVIEDDDNPLSAPGVALTTEQLTQISTYMIENVNQSRADNKKSKLKNASRLTKSSKLRAKELPKRWSHTRPSGKRWVTALKYYGIKTSKAYSAENLATMTLMARPEYTEEDLQMFAEVIHRNLIASSGHKKNILGSKYKYTGIGVYQKLSSGRLTIYVCEHFCSRYH